MVRSVARRLLESFGLTVHVAEGGPEAVARLGRAPDAIDAVLLDMTMPEMSGADVFIRLREIRPDLPVVLMSGYHEDELTRGGRGRDQRLRPEAVHAGRSRQPDARGARPEAQPGDPSTAEAPGHR